jgi:hypothetical protein
MKERGGDQPVAVDVLLLLRLSKIARPTRMTAGSVS